MRNVSKKVVAIVGPTAVGKSALAVRLAKKLDGEIISADSRQVYKGLDIGTGKLSKKEMRGVPHHLLDAANPKRQFSVADYQKRAQKSLEDIQQRDRLPILVGGTGLYIDTLLGKFTIPEVPPNPKLRRQLEKKSTETLFKMLQKLDPSRAKAIDCHNPRRLIRAIEIVKTLGKVPHLQPTADSRQRDILWIGLTLPPQELKKRIRIRLFVRISEQGMIQEARRLHRRGLSWKRMDALGLEYRCLARFLQKKITREEMFNQLEKEICRYAKRQMTWFKRNKDIKWFDPKETKKIQGTVSAFLRR